MTAGSTFYKPAHTMGGSSHTKSAGGARYQATGAGAGYASKSSYYNYDGALSFLWYRFIELADQVNTMYQDMATTNVYLLLITIAVYVALGLYLVETLFRISTAWRGTQIVHSTPDGGYTEFELNDATSFRMTANQRRQASIDGKTTSGMNGVEKDTFLVKSATMTSSADAATMMGAKKVPPPIPPKRTASRMASCDTALDKKLLDVPMLMADQDVVGPPSVVDVDYNSPNSASSIERDWNKL